MIRHPILRLAPLLVLAALGACDDKGNTTSGDSAGGLDTYTPPADGDGDGWTTTDGDCDDANADVYPTRDEDCNGVDDNCNGVVDEGFADTDADGTADCVDKEECDGIDNDGDGEIDEDFPDADGDGVPDCRGTEECDGVDNDGDGEIDEGFDADGDGYTECGSDETAADCDDEDASVNPGAEEVDGDLVDNDCDGLVDEGNWTEGAFYITEIMNNPGVVSDPDGEWFEIYNDSADTLVLNGIVISSSSDGDWHQVTSDELLLLDPGEYFVFGANDDVLTNGGVEVDYVYEDVSLSNEVDDIILDADGVIVDEVAWDDGDTFPDEAGASMNLDPTYYGAALNDDGANWCRASRRWDTATDFGSPGSQNQFCWPVASASYDPRSSLFTCDTLYLDGSGSSDPEGLSLTYEWELTSAPASSALTTADIETPTDVNPTFVPDVAGIYVFTLTVYNGYEYSPPSSVSVTISERPYNTDPTADAGADQSYSEDASCTPISYGASYDCPDCSDYDFELDGSGSTDADGDDLSDPTWSISYDPGSYASITDEDTWTPTVTLSGVPATYGSDTTATVRVQLTVTDCMGATDTDEVELTYTCTGT